jgi:hypothetical protein
MAGLVPAIHVFGAAGENKTWMPATSAGMTWVDLSVTRPQYTTAVDCISDAPRRGVARKAQSSGF